MPKTIFSLFSETNHPVTVKFGTSQFCDGASINLRAFDDVVFHTRFYGLPYLEVRVHNVGADDREWGICHIQDIIMWRFGQKSEDLPESIYPLDLLFGRTQQTSKDLEIATFPVCDSLCSVTIKITEHTVTRPRLPGWQNTFRTADCYFGEDGCNCHGNMHWYRGFMVRDMTEALELVLRGLASSDDE